MPRQPACRQAASWLLTTAVPGSSLGRAETPRIASDPGRKCATSSRTRLAAQRAAVRRAATRRVVGGTTRPTSWRAPVSTHHSLAPRAIDGPIDPGETIRCAAAALEPGLLPCQPASSQRPLIHRLHSTAFPPVAISTAFHHTLRTVCKSRLSLCCMRRVRAGLSCSDVEPSPTHPWRDAWQRGARRRGARGRARRVASGGFASPRLCVPVGVPGRASPPTPRLAAVSARAGRRRDRWLENDAAAPVRCCMVYG